MKFLRCLLVIFCGLLTTPLFADEEIHKVLNPVEVKTEMRVSSVPKEIEGLQWNRWTSKNFVVLALNDTYAQYLNRHLELVKTWTLARWGLFDVDFSVPCKLICVDDPILFEKLFKLKQTKVEVRRDESGRIKETVIFLLANDSPSHSVPAPLTEVALAEFGQKYNTNFGWWLYRGMGHLNGPLDHIRRQIADVQPHLAGNDPLYFSKGLLELTREQYVKLSDDQKKMYDASAVMFCLMIRKEFGQEKFHHMMKDTASSPETGLTRGTGFDSYDSFDRTFKRYMIDLTADVVANKTPDHYLQIYEPMKD